jgi:pimeloyl-ACP methyl ester carboxylesterase
VIARVRLVLLVGVLLLPACGGTSDDGPNEASNSGERVQFEAADRVQLAGRIFGAGEVGVVMAHMGREEDSQADWFRLARPLAERGYLVLTYNRRGVCSAPGRECSAGADDYASSWKDVVGAVEAVRSKGATNVVLIGASIGAMASLYASVSRRVDPKALIEIGGVNHASGYDFSREQLRRLKSAKLFISSAEDVYGGADAAREWHSWALEPKRLEILPGGEHGTDMFREGEPTARPLIQLVSTFLATVAPARP